jgi:cytochrome c oxidase subunit II
MKVMARLLFVPALLLLADAMPAATRLQAPAARIVEITAQRFEFWPSEIRVRLDEPVALRISSDDTMHGFRIVGAGVNLLVPKRGKGYATATFTGTRPGRYTIECSRMCGAGHNFMRATLVVEPAGGGTR